MPSERSAGLVDDGGDCLVLVDVRVDADHIFDVAPRRSLSSATAATRWAALGVVDALVDDVVAPRRSLSSATAAPHWAALDVVHALVDGVKEFSTGNIALPPLRVLENSVHVSPSEMLSSQGSKSESSFSKSHSG